MLCQLFGMNGSLRQTLSSAFFYFFSFLLLQPAICSLQVKSESAGGDPKSRGCCNHRRTATCDLQQKIWGVS